MPSALDIGCHCPGIERTRASLSSFARRLGSQCHTVGSWSLILQEGPTKYVMALGSYSTETLKRVH